MNTTSRDGFFGRMDALQEFQQFCLLAKQKNRTAEIIAGMANHRATLLLWEYEIQEESNTMFLVYKGWKVAKTTPVKGVITL